MTTYKITHTPFTIGEPQDIVEGLDLEDAKKRLKRRAERMQDKYPGCDINWDMDDGMGYELTDDDAVMVGDYQGRTQIVREHEEERDALDDDRDQENQVESASYDNHDWDSDPDWR